MNLYKVEITRLTEEEYDFIVKNYEVASHSVVAGGYNINELLVGADCIHIIEERFKDFKDRMKIIRIGYGNLIEDRIKIERK